MLPSCTNKLILTGRNECTFMSIRPGSHVESHTPALSDCSPRTLSLCSTAVARSYLSYEKALRLKVLPLGLVERLGTRVLTFLVAEGEALTARNALRFLLDVEVRLVEVPLDPLMRAIFLAYCGDDAKLEQQVARLSHLTTVTATAVDDVSPPAGEVGAFVEAVVQYALARGASDLHLVPQRCGAMIQLRVDGLLHRRDTPVCTLPRHAEIIRRLKVLAQLPTADRGVPLDGAFRTRIGDQVVRIRLSIMPTEFGEKAVLRLPSLAMHKRLDELSLDASLRALLSEVCIRGQGALLVAGPTGSGKTTTMYALAYELAQRGASVASVEDPVEQHIEGVAQTSVSAEHGADYATCVRALLRQDPDVIMLGEIRDRTTATTAFQAALAGKYLISAVHGGSVSEVLQRLMLFEVDRATLGQGVRAIVCQRLLPLLCEKCRSIDAASSQHIGRKVYRPGGCKECGGTGVRGVQVAAEWLQFTDRIARHLREGRTLDELLDLAARQGSFRPLEIALFDLLSRGAISYYSYRTAGGTR